jgi:hypothetical protein
VADELYGWLLQISNIFGRIFSIYSFWKDRVVAIAALY